MQSPKEIEDLLKVSGLLSLETKEQKRIRLGLKNWIFPDDIDLDKFNDYVALMKQQHPHMKPSRMQRKVAQHFKIKLID